MTITRDGVVRRPSRFVYRCTSADGRLLYVGISANPVSRVNQHRTGWWGWLLADVEVTEYATANEAREVEALAIATERPRFNRQGRWATRADWDVQDYRDFYDATRFGAFSSHQSRRMEQTRSECLRRFGVDITEPIKEHIA